MSKEAKTKLFVLASLVLLGMGNTAATWIRGDQRKAVESAVLVIAIGLLLLLLARRSDKLRRQLFATDERSDAIGIFAAAWAGAALWVTIFCVYLVEFARGHSGEPYYWLSAIYVPLFVLLAIGRSLKQ